LCPSQVKVKAVADEARHIMTAAMQYIVEGIEVRRGICDVKVDAEALLRRG
jgi:hypothetical protein